MNLVDGLDEPEGPLLLPDGSWCCVECGAARACVTWISADGKQRRTIARLGRPNGLALDRDGYIWVAESHPEPSVIRLRLGGEPEIVTRGTADRPFLFPNDLCIGPNGSVYLTDSGILFADLAPGGQLRPDYDELPFDGRILEIDRGSGAIRELDAGLRLANGLAFGPDDVLYATEMLTGNIFAYDHVANGEAGARRLVGNVIDAELPEGYGPGGYRGPDGMACSADGNIYQAVYGQQDVVLLRPDGVVEQRIKTTGRFPTNVAFGPSGTGQIFVTETEFGTIEMIDVGIDGWTLHT